MEYQFHNLRLLIKENLLNIISRTVVIFMNACKIENYRNTRFGKIVMVGTVIEAVGIFRIIKSVIEL
ncbi:hypothetical protein D3C87_2018970 [compost metagenome]